MVRPPPPSRRRSASGRPRPARPAARPPRESVSDAEYRRRYERELRRYVARFGPLPTSGAGEAYLSTGRWVWIEGGAKTIARWARYASLHHGLKVMAPDGTWRPWDPLTIR